MVGAWKGRLAWDMRPSLAEHVRERNRKLAEGYPWPKIWAAAAEGMERAALYSSLQGARVLELGVGAWRWLEMYPAGTTVVGLEPDEDRCLAAAARAARVTELPNGPQEATVVQAVAEKIPFADDSFDVVVSSLALCSVDVPVVLGEVARVLNGMGVFRCYEHVKPDPACLAKLDHSRVTCRLDLAPEAQLRAAGFVVLPGWLRFVQHHQGGPGPVPHVIGEAFTSLDALTVRRTQIEKRQREREWPSLVCNQL